MERDAYYMKKALEIASYACGRTSPNPLVGSVIVKDDRIVGQGWHRKAGTPHAEIHALNQAGELAKGATVYVTLEPCSHTGRTGPCADALIRAGVKRVVIAMVDPNPAVAGNGIRKLRQAGIEVSSGLMAKEAAELNRIFIKWISTKMPYTIVKSAMSLDGKIATDTGESQWITNEKARKRGHALRDMCDGIVVGINTVLADNPSLTTRLDDAVGKNPIRIVLDSHVRIPLDCKMLNDGASPVIVITTSDADPNKIRAIEAKGAEVIIASSINGRVDMKDAFRLLGERQIASLLIEGGAQIVSSVIREGLADEQMTFIAPILIGGKNAPSAFGELGVSYLSDAVTLEDITVEELDGNYLFRGYFKNRGGRDVYRTCGRIGEGQGN